MDTYQCMHLTIANQLAVEFDEFVVLVMNHSYLLVRRYLIDSVDGIYYVYLNLK